MLRDESGQVGRIRTEKCAHEFELCPGFQKPKRRL